MFQQFTTYIAGIFMFLLVIFVIDACSKQTLKSSLNKLKNKEIQAVRGVHISHDVLSNRKKIIETLDFCKGMQVNAIFIRVWDKGTVAFPSQVMKNSGNSQFNSQKYDHADPLKFLIAQAHQRQLKVFTIFDFELDYQHHKKNTVLFKNHQERLAMASDKRPALRFGEPQLNTLNPNIQNFTINLITEMVRFYKPDGVQVNTGLTVEAGYDPLTIQRYQDENHGKNPPSYPRDFEWVEWRTAILTEYAEKLYQRIKKTNPSTLIAVMPNEYPKCKADNLQDWIHQVRGGFTDVISPRLYRENMNLYQENLDNLLHFQVDKEHLKLIFPDIMPENPDEKLSEELVKMMLEAHRNRKIYGEIVPYDILVHQKDYFKKLYKIKAIFPKEVQQKKWKKRKKLIQRQQGKAGIADNELQEPTSTEEGEITEDGTAIDPSDESSEMQGQEDNQMP